VLYDKLAELFQSIERKNQLQSSVLFINSATSAEAATEEIIYQEGDSFCYS
jgi:hypothetical protein